jgi:hypothetical protein
MKRRSWPLAQAVLAILASLASPAAANADASEDLKALLVDLPGWQGADRQGWDLSNAGSRMVSAMRQYAGDDRTLDVSIVAGAAAQGGVSSGLKEGYKLDTSDVLMEFRRVDGFLVLSNFEKGPQSGTITVIINDPVTSSGPAAILSVNFEGIGVDDALGAARKLDWKAMKRIAAALK